MAFAWSFRTRTRPRRGWWSAGGKRARRHWRSSRLCRAMRPGSKRWSRTCPSAARLRAMQILGICGSLRKASLNMAALRACNELLPQGMSLRITSIADLPMFNQDVFDAGIPEPAKRLRAEIAEADGVLIASPEYNFSLTAVLKNAIDWASRPPNQSWQDKPVAIFSVSQGPLGGARVQYDGRRILGPLWARVLPRAEGFIGAAAGKVGAPGQPTGEDTRQFLADLLAGFKPWIERMKVKK